MKDGRIVELAEKLINYSVALKKGEKLLIESIGFELPLTKELIKEAFRIGAYPFVTEKNQEIMRLIFSGATEEHVKSMVKYEAKRMKDMDAYIGLRCSPNMSEFSGLAPEHLALYMTGYIKPLHTDIRRGKKWVVLRYPNDSMAQSANMATEKFEDFYFSVCNLDYARLSKAMDPLVELIEKTDMVRITAANTDISFSVKGMPAIKCAGSHNIPDGEVFTAPVIDSVNGHITYNTPSMHEGFRHESIFFRVKDGKIVDASSNNTAKVIESLDTDKGSRYFGEFAFGVNPYIRSPILDTLFDEKIYGSIHLTPGSAYKECDNGNDSALHWDLILIQRPEYGGGEVWFDGRLINKDGRFVAEELLPLNPENFVK